MASTSTMMYAAQAQKAPLMNAVTPIFTIATLRKLLELFVKKELQPQPRRQWDPRSLITLVNFELVLVVKHGLFAYLCYSFCSNTKLSVLVSFHVKRNLNNAPSKKLISEQFTLKANIKIVTSFYLFSQVLVNSAIRNCIVVKALLMFHQSGYSWNALTKQFAFCSSTC